MSPIETFLGRFQASLTGNSFRKLTLGKFRKEEQSLQHVYVRLVSIKGESKLSFNYRYPTRDVTKNYSIAAGTTLLRDWIGKTSLSATLLTAIERQQLTFNRRGKPRLTTSLENHSKLERRHDRAKARLLRDERFLLALGILDPHGRPRRQMGDKHRQIHQFVEIVAPILRDLPSGRPVRVVDMGAGKGYLTFALHAFLCDQGIAAETTGIERRKDLVETCNRVARECGYSGLYFRSAEIADIDLQGVDILVALHACDTGTDEAIFRGVQSGAGWIFVAPCCHKEVRPQIRAPAGLNPLFQYGIQIDRLAETVTDTLRTMYLEACGYAARIQEFIPVEHTTKNLLIIARKSPQKTDPEISWKRAADFQALFGIQHQRLAELLLARSLSNAEHGASISLRG
jgi:hypothetical protein